MRLSLYTFVYLCCLVVCARSADPPLPASALFSHLPPKSTYDFVIVGAGSAGSVLAARLCARLHNASVLLVEQGAPEESGSRSEFFATASRMLLDAWQDRNLTDFYYAQPGPGLLNPSGLPGLTGRALGGSSRMNGMQFTFPYDSDGVYARWAFESLTGKKARRLLRRVRRTIGDVTHPPRARIPGYTFPWLRAAVKSGMTYTNRPFSPALVGKDAVFVTRDGFDRAGRRRDTFTAYVAPAIRRGGACDGRLHVLHSAAVTRVLFGAGAAPRTATGVAFRLTASDDPTQEHRVLARREVILTAGPYGTPLLLQRSGIGPRRVSERLGVPVVRDLPVGLQCKVRTSTGVVAVTARLAAVNDPAVHSDPAARARFDAGGGGPFAVMVGGLNGNVGRESEIVLFNGANVLPPTDDAPSLFDAFRGGQFLIGTCVTNPAPATYSTLEALRDGSAKHVFNALESADDMRAVMRCMRTLLRVFQRMPDAAILLPRQGVNVSDAELEAFVRVSTSHGLHFVGGAAKGPVVNKWHGVHGVGGLRVVDASALPSLPDAAGPFTSVLVAAENMAELLTRLYVRKVSKRGV